MLKLTHTQKTLKPRPHKLLQRPLYAFAFPLRAPFLFTPYAFYRFRSTIAPFH